MDRYGPVQSHIALRQPQPLPNGAAIDLIVEWVRHSQDLPIALNSVSPKENSCGIEL